MLAAGGAGVPSSPAIEPAIFSGSQSPQPQIIDPFDGKNRPGHVWRRSARTSLYGPDDLYSFRIQRGGDWGYDSPLATTSWLHLVEMLIVMGSS